MIQTRNRTIQTVSIAEAKSKLSAVINAVVESGQALAIESHGEPKVIVTPFGDYIAMHSLRQKIARYEALERLRTIAQQVSARFDADAVSTAERERIADGCAQAFVADLEAEGKIRFE